MHSLNSKNETVPLTLDQLFVGLWRFLLPSKIAICHQCAGPHLSLRPTCPGEHSYTCYLHKMGTQNCIGLKLAMTLIILWTVTIANISASAFLSTCKQDKDKQAWKRQTRWYDNWYHFALWSRFRKFWRVKNVYWSPVMSFSHIHQVIICFHDIDIL